jgi:hypothetical protein
MTLDVLKLNLRPDFALSLAGFFFSCSFDMTKVLPAPVLTVPGRVAR